jgi:hypothetical protein
MMNGEHRGVWLGVRQASSTPRVQFCEASEPIHVRCLGGADKNIADQCRQAWRKLIAQPWSITSIRLRDWTHWF